MYVYMDSSVMSSMFHFGQKENRQINVTQKRSVLSELKSSGYTHIHRASTSA